MSHRPPKKGFPAILERFREGAKKLLRVKTRVQMDSLYEGIFTECQDAELPRHEKIKHLKVAMEAGLAKRFTSNCNMLHGSPTGSITREMLLHRCTPDEVLEDLTNRATDYQEEPVEEPMLKPQPTT